MTPVSPLLPLAAGLLLLAGSKHPGKAPEAGAMKKVEVALPPVAVQTAPVEHQEMPRYATLTGTVVANRQSDVAAQEVQQRIYAALGELPRGIDPPVIQKLEPDAQPVLFVALRAPGKSVREVTVVADHLVWRRLETVNGVGEALLLGGRKRQVDVQVDPVKLRALGISPLKVAAAINGQNITLPGGRVDQVPSAEQAQELRPDLKAARASLDLASSQRRGTYYKYLPPVRASYTYRWTNVTGFTGRQDNWFITVGRTWTPWDGGLRESELRENAAKVAESTAALQALSNRAREELERALLDLESARANRVKAEEQLRLARESAQVVDVNYKAGEATYLEVTDATTALRQAGLGAIAELLNAELAELKVARAAGLFTGERPRPTGSTSSAQ